MADTLTPEDGTASEETSVIEDGKAKITVSADFKGTIHITCADKAGNISEEVTAGEELGTTGFIIENHAPHIGFQTDGDAVQDEYETAPAVTVSVTDDKDNIISAGLSSVTYKIGSGEETSVSEDFTTDMKTGVSFVIPANKIEAGETVITVTAIDNAGNQNTVTQTIRVHAHGVKEIVPEKAVTCTESGNPEYYICSCKKLFQDSSCTKEVTEQDVVTAALGHDYSGKYENDEEYHWKVCSRCKQIQTKEEHIFDDDKDRNCNVCGYERPAGEAGTVSKDVENGENAPNTKLSTDTKELADIILTEEEKAKVEKGTDVKFILNVEDAGDNVSSGDKAVVQEVLNGNSEAKGFAIGQYIDISLFKVVGTERSAISETEKKLTIVIDVPEGLKSTDSGKPRTYAVIRVHDGVAEILTDLDDNDDTITIATDRFSIYAI